MPLQTGNITRDTPNPLSPSPAIPVPAPGTTPPPPAPGNVTTQLPSPVPPYPDYPQPGALNTTEFRHAQAPDLNSPGGTVSQGTVIDFPVNTTLPYRKLYAYLSLIPNVADYLFNGWVEFWRDNTKVTAIPLFGSGGTIVAQTAEIMPTVLCAGGVVAPDSLGIFLSDSTQVVLQPFYLYGYFDRVTVRIAKTWNVENASIFIAITSSIQR